MLKLVGIDMDDTLLRGNKTFEESRFKQIFNDFKGQGIVMVIASGNSYPRLDEYFSYMNHDDLYFAGDNGNFIVKKDNILQRNTMDPLELKEVAKFLEKSSDFSNIYCDGIDSYSTGINKKYEEYILSYYGNLKIVDSIDDIPMDKIVKISNHSGLPLNDVKNYAEYITEIFSTVDAVTSGGGWFDIFDISGGKGAAITTLQEKYGITPEETMVFGDSLNDESMMEFAKYSVAMSNADESLKRLANYVIKSNEEQAVVEVLEECSQTGSLDFMERFVNKATVFNR